MPLGGVTSGKRSIALGPVKPAGPETKAPKDFLFGAEKTVSSGDLPPYYLVYFLLADLLGFKNLDGVTEMLRRGKNAEAGRSGRQSSRFRTGMVEKWRAGGNEDANPYVIEIII